MPPPANKKALAIGIAIGLAAYVVWYENVLRLWTWTGPTMGTTYTVKIVEHGTTRAGMDQVRAEIDALLAEIDFQMSTYRPDSEISRFNGTNSTAPVAVSTALTAVVSGALDLAEKSGGAFDPTFEPVFKLWGFGAKGPKRIPAQDEQAAAVARSGYAHLHVDAPGLLRKDIPGLAFNLNAIAPGYASDRIASLLESRGLTNIYVDVGGEEVARGHNLKRSAWSVGIEKPRLGAAYAESLEEAVPLRDRALSTSGDYRNFFTNESGQVFSHIFDPRVGRPATGTVGSVSVIAPNCTLADGLATTLFVLGAEDGLRFLTNFPGAEALFIVRREDDTYAESRSAGFPAAQP